MSPSLPINPGIVEVKTRLTSKIGRLFPANSITLIPGTLTVHIKGDSLFIHWVDVLIIISLSVLVLASAILAAPDVAMTEAAIGSGLSTIIFFYVLNRVRGSS